MTAADSNAARALIVDDEADIRALLEITLGRMGIDTVAISDLASARRAFGAQRFDLCLTDMRLPDGKGIELIRHISDHEAPCPVAVITAYGSTEAAVASLKAGAFDFVSKPIEMTGLRTLITRALQLAGSSRNMQRDSSSQASPRLIGNTQAMTALRGTISKLARSQAPVYITGESGTGKELVARRIHAEGPRATGAFVPVNCGAIPAELMESEFFGYLRGAFTGADRDTPGLFARADGGTLFLDEIADLPLSMQVKLLRAIQERSIRPVGATMETDIDVRIVSASHHDLSIEVARDRFREDLYYRLNVIEVEVPPLRERAADIPALTERILAGLARKMRLEHPPRLSEGALAALMSHSFPGNIRELENVLERAVTLAESPRIEREYLRLHSPLAETVAPLPAPQMNGSSDLESQLKAVERERIQSALEACRYNKTRAAQQLGITFRALRYRLAKLDME